jgi:hypothetical protein
MVKICLTGLLKLNFETIPKKCIFWFFAKNFGKLLMKLKFFFANFQILWPLGCQGWVVIPQNVKNAKITAPYWRYSQSYWYFRPSFVNCCPSNLFSGSSPPPPHLPMWISILYMYTRIQCVKGEEVWCFGPQTDKHLPQNPFTVHFLDDDILHCLLCVLYFYECYQLFRKFSGQPYQKIRHCRKSSTPGPR